VQAAKALRTAVLHDARNIKGKDAIDDNGLAYTGVGNAAEAKVHQSTRLMVNPV
jgi:hypothetical protein